MDWATAVAMVRARRVRRVKSGFILLGYGSQKQLLTGDKGGRRDGCSLFWGAKIGDFWEICKRMGEKMRKIVYFAYFITRIWA